MRLATPYEIKIPRDSITGTETAGVLGETYVEINTTQASGPPVENYGYLKSRPSIPPTSFEDYLKALVGAAKDLKEVDKEIRSPNPPSPAQRHNKRKTPSP
jgi:ABC-type transporter Mla subunit MlaD